LEFGVRRSATEDRNSNLEECLVTQWIRIASVSDCPPGSGLEAVAGDRVVALYNVDGGFHALDGVCPHQGGPLGKGKLAGCIVTCPWHGWQFDVTTGRHQLSPTIVQPRLELRVENDSVFVNVDPAT
jgi:nitrite reductase/ring-hydroxylating ferredoxin subunit